MKYNPVEFVLVRKTQYACVVGYPFQAYINLTLGWLTGTGQVKTDNVCIIIMLQELLVDAQQVVVGTKYIGKGTERRLLFFKKHAEKSCQFFSLPRISALF